MQKTNSNPYLVGVGMGLLSMAVFAIVNTPLGITTTLSQASGGVASIFVGTETVNANAYWAKNVFKLDYGLLFVIGTMLGAFLSSWFSGTFKLESVPSVWQQQYGPSSFKRYIVAFFGGILIMYGARLAGGCTSGHGISGGLQLALSSWIFLAVMFTSAIITAKFMFSANSKA